MSDRKIGLLIINGPLPPPYGGVATYLAHTLPFLAARGFEVHTIIDRQPADPKQYAEFQRARVHIYYGVCRWLSMQAHDDVATDFTRDRNVSQTITLLFQLAHQRG